MEIRNDENKKHRSTKHIMVVSNNTKSEYKQCGGQQARGIRIDSLQNIHVPVRKPLFQTARRHHDSRIGAKSQIDESAR